MRSRASNSSVYLYCPSDRPVRYSASAGMREPRLIEVWVAGQ